MNSWSGVPAGTDSAGAGKAGVPEALLLLTGSQTLHEEIARIAAAADRELIVCAGIGEAAAAAAATLLIDVDTALRTGVPAAARRGGRRIILLAGPGQAHVWELAAELGAHRVAVLPDAAAWLVDHLRPAPAASPAVVLGVAGACGGAGTSTTACWLAQEALHTGPVLLLDADPGSHGLDLCLDIADAPGLRWSGLRDVRGSIHPEQLFPALPTAAGISVLSGRDGPPDAQLLDAVLEAGRSTAGTVVMDLGRGGGSASGRCDAVLLVVPGTHRALLAAAQSAVRLSGAQVVVRGPLADGLDEQRAAEIVGLPLAGYLPRYPRLDRESDRVGVLAAGRRRSVRRRLQGVLAAGLARTAGAP